jgi:hypothetical protein
VSAVLAIARREARERRFLLAAAVALSLLAAIFAALPVSAGVHALAQNLVLVLYLAFPVSIALAVGSSLIGRDLEEGRLSFYFARPLSAGALWAGKFLGGAALVGGAFLCCYVPMAMNVGGASGVDPRASALHVLALLGLMALAHVLTAIYRSGSRLLVLDLCLGGVFVAVTAGQLRSLVAAGAMHAVFETLLRVAVAAATIALLAAAAAQLAYGRADARRGHVALSATVWTLALLALAALTLWRGWVLGVTPEEVMGPHPPVLAAPRGGALLFRGDASRGRAGFSPVFLMDTASGAYVRLAPERVGRPAFAGDGRRAVWVAPRFPWWWYVAPFSSDSFPDLGDPDAREAVRRGSTLVVARLGPGTPATEERPLELPGAATAALAADADGRKVVLAGPSSVFLVDVASARALASAPLADVVAADFLPDGIVRFYQAETGGRPRAGLRVLDWNTGDGSRVERAHVAGDARLMLIARRGDLAVVSAGAGARALVRADGTVRWLESRVPDFPGAALVLANGDVALSLGEEVRIVTRDGGDVSRLVLEPGNRVYAMREPAPGEVAVGLWTLSLGERRTVFLEAATGRVRREEAGLLPAGPRTADLPAPEPGSPASRLFTDAEGRIVALDPDGRKREVVASR